MQAIRTRYIGASDKRPSRVSAQCAAGRVVIHWEHGADTFANHANAARALRDKLGWTEANGYPPIYGGSFDTAGYHFVFASKSERL